MRAQLACKNCRRSKIRCTNGGIGTTCRACQSSGRTCVYPEPGTGGQASRESGRHEDGSATGATPRRPRPKKTVIPTFIPTDTSGVSDSPRAIIDALDSKLLTPRVWTELFDIFQLHFSTDLPFLHPPTFLKPLRQVALQPPSPETFSPSNQNQGPTPPYSPLLLLAFLALTARFHPSLVAHHAPSSTTRLPAPLVCAEYYACAARARMLGTYGESLGMPDLERTQALLMLGLHEWGMCRGERAWILVGSAGRYAQLMGLQYEHDLDDEPMARSLAMTNEAHHLGVDPNRRGSKGARTFTKGEAFIEQEIRRRTFWSCFVMDRYLSSGKYRPQMFHIKELRIQLPSSERAFLFGERVRTLLLGEDLDDVATRAEVQSQRRQSVLLGTGSLDAFRNPRSSAMTGGFYCGFGENRGRDEEENGKWEVGADEGVLSRFVKVLEIYGRIVKWSCLGGRRTERWPPWDGRSTFFELRRQVSAFRDALPRDLTLTTANVSAHITSRTSTPYMLMHVVHSLCSIMLHREYVPFLPLRCSKPQGPLDPPLFTPDEYDIPEGFWDESARDCFKPARDIMDLVRTCQEWGVLVETPIVGFAVYTVAFTGVYCINFPWMDPDGYLCAKAPSSTLQVPGSYAAPQDNHGMEAARKALETIGSMRKRLKMADGWFRTIRRMHMYFGRIKKDFRRNTRALAASSASESEGSPDTSRHLSLREGGGGGGLEEYKLLEATLKEFGTLEDEDLEMMDPGADDDTASRLRQTDELSDIGTPAVVKNEDAAAAAEAVDNGIRQERWNAINSVAAAAAAAQAAQQSGSMAAPGYSSFAPQISPHASISSASAPQFPPSTGPTPLLSPGSHNSVSTPSLSSPYERASLTSITSAGTYATPTFTGPFGTLHHPAGTTPMSAHNLHSQQTQAQQQPWNEGMKESWLNSLDTRLGGDDIAAFVDGNNWEDWAGMAQQAEVSGWLSQVWNNN